jgi:hypothetical protein
MERQNFTCSIAVPVTAAAAFNAITNVQGWWAKNVEGDTQSPGGIFTVRFGETRGSFKIAELIPGEKMIWQVTDCYLPIFKNTTDWAGTEIHWDIITAEDAALVIFTHVGLVPGKECYNDCVGGWAFYIKESLYKLVTQGEGLPGTGIRCTIASGNRTYKGTLFFKNDPLPALPGEYILVDVNELQGEHVVSANAVQRLDKNNFSAEQISGKYYLVVANEPVFAGVDPLEDMLTNVQQLMQLN